MANNLCRLCDVPRGAAVHAAVHVLEEKHWQENNGSLLYLVELYHTVAVMRCSSSVYMCQ